MKSLLLLGMLLPTSLATAQVRVEFEAPTIRFETTPELIEIEPGIRVVPNYPEEVFYVGGWYWSRRGEHWFRTHDYHGGWEVADRFAPAHLRQLPPGRYRQWRREEVREGPRERHDERPEDRHEERRERRGEHDHEHEH